MCDCNISSAPILLAGLLKDTRFTGRIWQASLTILGIFPREENFKAQAVLQDKNIITTDGLHIKRLREKVLLSLGLVDDADNWNGIGIRKEDLIFTLSERKSLLKWSMNLKIPSDQYFLKFKEKGTEPDLNSRKKERSV